MERRKHSMTAKSALMMREASMACTGVQGASSVRAYSTIWRRAAVSSAVASGLTGSALSVVRSMVVRMARMGVIGGAGLGFGGMGGFLGREESVRRLHKALQRFRSIRRMDARRR